MSESDKIRLDPATLRHACEVIVRYLQAPIDAIRESCEREAIAAEAAAAAQPPRLSDWLRACEESKLGPPTPGRFQGGCALFLGDGDDEAWVVPYERHAIMYWRGGSMRSCSTPAELTAALNVLAEDMTRAGRLPGNKENDK